jgi:hypothetical protein
MVTVKEFVKIQIREDGKAISEIRSGDDFWRKKNKWMNMNWVIDWKNNLYRKTITDPRSGEVVRHCEEPLDKHQGYGSAKHRTAIAEHEFPTNHNLPAHVEAV